jgi:hypothetical protein
MFPLSCVVVLVLALYVCLSVLYCCLSIRLIIILLSFCVLFNGMFMFVYCPVSFFYGLCFLFIWMCTFSLFLFLSLLHYFKDQCGFLLFLAFCLIHHFCLPRLCLELRQSHTILKRDVTVSCFKLNVNVIVYVKHFFERFSSNIFHFHHFLVYSV